jgi:hypothetical protein
MIKSYLFTSAFNISHSETNLLKFELGISNDLASLLYLPLVSGDNNFTYRSSAPIAAVYCHILQIFEEKNMFVYFAPFLLQKAVRSVFSLILR